MKVTNAVYIDGYRLSILFNDGKNTIVDFQPFLETQGNGYLKKYKNHSAFKQFTIEDGNLVWGHDWDLIFPLTQLYQGKISI